MVAQKLPSTVSSDPLVEKKTTVSRSIVMFVFLSGQGLARRQNRTSTRTVSTKLNQADTDLAEQWDCSHISMQSSEFLHHPPVAGLTNPRPTVLPGAYQTFASSVTLHWFKNSSSKRSSADDRSSGSHRNIFRTKRRRSSLSLPSKRFSRASSVLSGIGTMPIQLPLIVSEVHVNTGMCLLTLQGPISTALVAHLLEPLRRRTYKGDHLSEMLLIVKMTFFYGAEESATFEQIPDLDLPSQQCTASIDSVAQHTITATDHMSILESHSMPRMISGAL